MTRTAATIVSCVFALLATGCVHFEKAGIAYFGVSHPKVVTIRNGDSCGRGVAIDHDKVLTVEHVVVGAAEVEVEIDGVRVAGTVESYRQGSPERLVVIALTCDEGLFSFDGFAVDELFLVGAGHARELITPRGYVVWGSPADALRPGDSGSPVVNESGELVALLTGRVGLEMVGTPVAPTGWNTPPAGAVSP